MEKKNKTDLVRALSTNKSDRFKSLWIDRWKSFDMFGQRVEFTFKGKRTYQTNIGALVSVLIQLFLGFFIAYEFYVVFSRKHPATSLKYRLNH
jgi:hypothetical protein